MSFKSKLNLEAKIFNPDERKRAFSNLPMRAAREMRNSLRKQSLASKPAGRIERYEDSSRGRGFQRRFQRSAPGQRFANETLTLLNAYDAKRLGDLSALVEIADKINPRNGANAKDYGAELQEREREVMTESDVAEAKADYDRRAKDTLRELLT